MMDIDGQIIHNIQEILPHYPYHATIIHVKAN